MNNKDFHIIAKEIISKNGIEIISKKQFPNLLADLGAYKDLPALKTILNELFKLGFGKFLYELKQNKEGDIFEKCFDHRKEFLSAGKYREDLTEYIYSSLLFALGLIDDIEEPKVKNPFSAEASQNQTKPKAKKRNAPALNLKKMLEDLKKEYLQTFDEIIVPKGKIAKASGYFTPETLNKQYILENKIIILSKRLGEDLDWCKVKKEEILSKHVQSKSAQRSKFGCLISIPIILLILVTGWTYNFIASADERAEFEQTMASALREKNNGNLIASIELYSKAETEYEAGWRNGYYKNRARKEAEIISSQIYAGQKTLLDEAISSNDYIKAASIIQALPQCLVLSGDDWNHYKSISNTIESSIEKTINIEIDKLLKSISKNGKLSKEESEMLKMLTTIAPNNYWVKFINSKEQ